MVCKEHINAVKEFLKQFYTEKKMKCSHTTWVTFEISPGFELNLTERKDQPMTQNMTFEITCETYEELENLAKRFNTKIKSYLCDETTHPYKYYYIDVFGPEGICKVEIHYVEWL